MLIIDFVGALLECLLIGYFCEHELKTRKYSRAVTYAGFIALTMIYFGSAVLILPVNGTIVLLKGALLFISLLIPAALYTGKLGSNFLLNVIFLAFQMGIEYIVTLFLVEFYHVTTFPAPEEFYALGLFMTRILAFVLTYILVGCLQKKDRAAYELSNKYTVLFLLLPILTIMIIWAITDIVIRTEGAVDFWQYFLPEFLLVCADVAVLYLLQKIAKAEKERFIVLQLESLQNDFENYYANISKKNEQIRRIQHDMRNYLITLYSLLENGDVVSAKEEIRQKLNYVDSKQEITTANGFLNTVLQIKKEQADQYDIAVEYLIHLPEYLAVKWTNIALVLSIAFDNAIEAASKLSERQQRYIRLQMYLHNAHLIVSMDNTMQGTAAITADGMVLSTKPDQDKHGYGLGNMKLLLDEIGGEMFLAAEEGLFRLKAVIPLQGDIASTKNRSGRGVDESEESDNADSGGHVSGLSCLL